MANIFARIKSLREKAKGLWLKSFMDGTGPSRKEQGRKIRHAGDREKKPTMTRSDKDIARMRRRVRNKIASKSRAKNRAR